MSDLLAKCDWDGDELHVELPQWPEVVNVWVKGRAMPFAPVTDPDALGVIKCLQGLADATSAENEKLRERVAELEELTDGKLYIPQEWYQLATAENAKLRELVAEIYEDQCDNSERWRYRDRMRELGIEVN